MSNSINKRLIKERGRKCQKCGLTQWLNQPINLEVHHIDGNHKNNEENNLLLLCPNCHSYTPNFSRSKKEAVSDEDLLYSLENSENIYQALLKVGLSTSGAQYIRVRKLIKNTDLESKFNKINYDNENYCIDCGKLIAKNSVRCIDCNNKNNFSKIEKPIREQLKKEIRENSFVSLGKKYGLTDNGIRKWCDSYNLPRTKKEINSYSNKEWELI